MSKEHTTNHDNHLTIGIYAGIYFLLLLFTVFSVIVSLFFQESIGKFLTITVILLFSTIKASLIVAYYMHLKYEKGTIRMWLYLPLIIFIIVFFALLPDILHPVKM